jgi:serine O-acetyltransferase
MIIKIYRLENWLYNHHLKVFALIIKMIIRVMFSAVIPPSVSIGEGTFITYHGLGVVIHKNAVIGKNCCIRQHVTIAGGRGGDSYDRR